MKKNKTVLIYPLRKEATVSGEKNSYLFLKSAINSNANYELVELDDIELYISSFFQFFSLARIVKLWQISSKSEVDILIVKLPTASQFILAKILTKRFKNKLMFVVDGLCWEFSSLKSLMNFIKYEPILTVARIILNNKLLIKIPSLHNIPILVASNLQANEILSKHKNSSVHIIPNVFYGKKELLNHTTYQRPRKLVFGYIGHAYYCKGLVTLLRALKSLKNSEINFDFVFAISSRGELEIINEINNLGFKVYREVEISQFFSNIDCLVAPFEVNWGTNIFSSVLLESIYFEKPVLTSNIEINKELFVKNENAIWFEAGCDISLAKAISETVNGKRKIPDAKDVKNEVMSKFCHEKVKNQWFDLLNL